MRPDIPKCSKAICVVTLDRRDLDEFMSHAPENYVFVAAELSPEVFIDKPDLNKWQDLATRIGAAFYAYYKRKEQNENVIV